MSDESRTQDETREPETGTVTPSPAPGGRWRRLVRGRPGVAVVGALVGALLGAGAVAWRTDTLPYVQGDMCWGSLSQDVVSGLFSEGEIRARELPIERARGNDDRVLGECRLTRYEDDRPRWQIAARVRALDELNGLDAREWPREFLSPRMVPLGGGIDGMVSPSRAWVALPKGCVSSSGRPHAPYVVELSSGSADMERESDPEYRPALARAVVRLANGVMEEFGCSGRYADPGELPAPAERAEAPERDVCGVKGLRWPDWPRKGKNYEYSQLVPAGDRAGVRSCDISLLGDRPEVRLTTVDDPDLAQLFRAPALQGGEQVKGTGYGRLGGDLSVFRTSCQTGDVVFVVQEFGTSHAWARALLPAYAKGEARRIGCGDVTVELPG